MSEYTGPVPVTTADGVWSVGVSHSETGQQDNVELSLYQPDAGGGFAERRVFEFPPSWAREVGRMLIESADGLDSR
ncbi:hypothetical protein DK926_19460 [Rhodococcus sp. Eu-32]|uniref:hypothetical protein n=1 Tax=Rhodococcus sp. Eu-32 TaxID=1017319 RepID=UPI000F79939C|nr:hypothetical protein [Rhodococcus sp. Eu-32]RRQ26178.1 hypothetical protein DK926_19460 [Rhodococcus sp. Eu-32]